MENVEETMQIGTTPDTAKKSGMLSIREKLEQLGTLDLEFGDINVQKDKDGKFIAVLTLTKPIPSVLGSQKVDLGDGPVEMRLEEVDTIRIHEDNFTDDFEFDAGSDSKSGRYKGSKLQLDIAKSSGDVWLVETSYAQSGQAYGSKQRQDRLKERWNKQNNKG